MDLGQALRAMDPRELKLSKITGKKIFEESREF